MVGYREAIRGRAILDTCHFGWVSLAIPVPEVFQATIKYEVIVMALRPPTDDDLRRLAEANHFQLNDEEIEGFRAIIPGLFDSYEQLDRMPVPKEPLKYPKRDPGQRPAPEDDPLNAIVRRCTLPGSGSGKLAGKRIGLKNNICVAGMPMPSSQPCPTIQRSRSRSLQIH